MNLMSDTYFAIGIIYALEPPLNENSTMQMNHEGSGQVDADGDSLLLGLLQHHSMYPVSPTYRDFATRHFQIHQALNLWDNSTETPDFVGGSIPHISSL